MKKIDNLEAAKNEVIRGISAMSDREIVEGYIESYDPARGVAIVNTLKGAVILHIAGYYGNIESTMEGNRRVIGDLMERDGELWFRTARPVETISA